MTLRRPLTRVSATVATMALAAAGTVALNPATSQAAASPVTDYGLAGVAYGTRIMSSTGLQSARSAFSYILCTREVGRAASNHIASIDLPAEDPQVEVDEVVSRNNSYRNRRVAAGMRSVNTIARVALAGSDSAGLTLEGLKTASLAWATRSGELRADNRFSATDITITAETGTPLDGALGDLVEASEGGLAEVIAVLRANPEGVVVPGLGRVSMGFDRTVVRQRSVTAQAFAVQVKLFGGDQTENTDDDSLVGIGRTASSVFTQVVSGVMNGGGWGLEADLLGGAASIGRVGLQPLPCQGTNGTILRAPAAGLDPGSTGTADVGASVGRAWGVQRPNGLAKAWTQGRVSEVTVGPLTLKGIVGRQNVEQDRAGRIVRNDIRGSVVAEVVVDGESQGKVTPGNARELEALEIPGIAELDFFARERGTRGGHVTAVTITLADGAPGVSELRLGNAQASIRRQ